MKPSSVRGSSSAAMGRSSTRRAWQRRRLPSATAMLGRHDAVVLGFGLLGLWAFANLEVGKALLRVEERWRAFLVATVGNVTLTVALTVALVVIRDEGARGLVAGNFVASAVTVVVL